MKRIAYVILAIVALWSSSAEALPMYALRSGRTCGNCHVSPTYQDERGFENPDLPERKCNMSCISCHTNPTGGGLRNASGRYYGQSTLAMLPLQERSYHDYDRELLSAELVRDFRSRFTRRLRGAADAMPAEQRIPYDFAAVKDGEGQGQDGGWSNFGKPALHPSRYAYWDGRYNDLNADPMVNLGADIRAAYWSCLLYTSPSPRDLSTSRMPSSA